MLPRLRVPSAISDLSCELSERHVIKMAEYEILLSSVDWQSHAFPVDYKGGTRWTACGAEFSAALLEPAGEKVPTCLDCAVEFGMQVARRLTEEAEVTRGRVAKMLSDDAAMMTPDVRASFAAKRLVALDARAAGLDGPAHNRVLRALRIRSTMVLTWVRWDQRAAFLFPAGLLLNGAGICDLLLHTDSWWALPAVIAGAIVLCVLAIGLWLANQQALRMVVGVYLEATPPPAAQDDRVD